MANWLDEQIESAKKTIDGWSPAKRAVMLGEIQVKSDRERLNSGRDYLMTVTSSDLNIEDALEAFGFSRNGIDR